MSKKPLKNLQQQGFNWQTINSNGFITKTIDHSIVVKVGPLSESKLLPVEVLPSWPAEIDEIMWGIWIFYWQDRLEAAWLHPIHCTSPIMSTVHLYDQKPPNGHEVIGGDVADFAAPARQCCASGELVANPVLPNLNTDDPKRLLKYQGQRSTHW